MAEDDTPNRVEDDEDAAPIVVASHDPLPPPPEVHYTRPELGHARPALPGDKPLGSWSDSSETVSHGAGLAAGSAFVVSIIAGAMLGNWIDLRWNHTGMPWATLIMTLIGAAAGFLNLKRILDRANRNKNQK